MKAYPPVWNFAKPFQFGGKFPHDEWEKDKMPIWDGWELLGSAALCTKEAEKGIAPGELSRLKEGVRRAQARIKAALDTPDKCKVAEEALENFLPKEVMLPAAKVFKANVDKINKVRDADRQGGQKPKQVDATSRKWESLEDHLAL